MHLTLDIPDDLVPAVAEILSNSSRPGWEDGEGQCSPGFIMKSLNITSEKYREAVGVLSSLQDLLEEAAKNLPKGK